MIKNVVNPPKDYIKKLEKKLEHCQSQTSVDDSEQQKQIDDEEDDTTVPYEQYSQYRHEQDRLEQQYIERS